MGGGGAPTRPLGGPRPRSTSQVVLRAGRPPRPRRPCLAQWREHRPPSRGWAARGSRERPRLPGRPEGRSGPSSRPDRPDRPQDSHAMPFFTQDPRDPSAFSAKEGSSPSHSQDGPATAQPRPSHGSQHWHPGASRPALGFLRHWLCGARGVCAQLTQLGGVPCVPKLRGQP